MTDQDLSGQGPLTQFELERLIERAPATIRRYIGRLFAEVRALRDTAAERQFMAEQELEL